jgi:hypothetical protein
VKSTSCGGAGEAQRKTPWIERAIPPGVCACEEVGPDLDHTCTYNVSRETLVQV